MTLSDGFAGAVHRMELHERLSPCFNGAEFANIGPYERLRGVVDAPGFFQPSNIPNIELPRARLSDRLFAGLADPERLWSHKWRGVRTAPKGVGP